jgi:hypothetical protein
VVVTTSLALGASGETVGVKDVACAPDLEHFETLPETCRPLPLVLLELLRISSGMVDSARAQSTARASVGAKNASAAKAAAERIFKWRAGEQEEAWQGEG